MKPVFITLTKQKDAPGRIGTSVMVRMYTEDHAYDRYTAISDEKNKASRLQMQASILKMIEEVQKL